MCALSVVHQHHPQCCVFKEIRFWLYPGLYEILNSKLSNTFCSDYCNQWRHRSVWYHQPPRVRVWLRPDGEADRLRPVELVESLGGDCAQVVKIAHVWMESALQPQTRRHSRVSDIFDWWERHYSDQYHFQRNDRFGQFGAADSLQFPGTDILRTTRLHLTSKEWLFQHLSNQLLDIVQDSIIFGFGRSEIVMLVIRRSVHIVFKKPCINIVSTGLGPAAILLSWHRAPCKVAYKLFNKYIKAYLFIICSQ